MMGGTSPQLGFTIVETLIVLSVTAVIFLSAALLIGGKVNATTFQQAMTQAQSQIQQRINEVVSGYYPYTTSFSCAASGNGPVFGPATASSGQGTNQACLFIGKALQLGLNTNPAQYNVYTIAALRLNASGQETTNLAQAKPVLVAQGSSPANSSNPDQFETAKFQYGATVRGMWHDNDSPFDPSDNANAIGSVAFMDNLGSTNPNTGQLTSGAQQVNLYALMTTPPNLVGQTKITGVDAIDNALATAMPVRSVQICLASGTTRNQSALLDIGNSNGSGSPLTVSMAIKDSADCT